MCEKNFFSGKIELPKKSVAIASVDMAEMGSFSTNKELKFTLAKNNFFASIWAENHKSQALQHSDKQANRANKQTDRQAGRRTDKSHLPFFMVKREFKAEI